MARQARALGWRYIGGMVLLATALSACRTMSMTIESDPPGAFVVVNQHPVGRTPVVLPRVPAQDHLSVTFLKEGLPPKTVIMLADSYGWWGFSLPSDRLAVKLGDGRRAELYGSDEPVWAPTR